MKKIFLFLLGIVVLLFVSALAVPFLFKDKIMAKVKSEINENLNAKVDFTDADIGIIRSFPDLNLTLHHLTVAGVDSFSGDTLADIEKLYLRLDIMSVIKGGKMAVKAFELDNPILKMIVLKGGTANWDIMKSDDTSAETEASEAFSAELQRYAISNGNVIYDDRDLGFFMAVNGLDHHGKGDFTSDMFELVTSTDAASFSMKYDGVPYLSSVVLKMKSKLSVDMNQMKFMIQENEASLNGLQLSVNGFVAMPTDDITMDLSFRSAKDDFGAFVSLVPTIYAAGMDGMKSSGKVTLSGFVKGVYNDNTMPSFGLNLNVENGMFNYASVTGSVSDVNIALAVTNPGGDLDKTIVNLSRFQASLNGDKAEAKLYLRNPISDPDIDMALNGTINLSNMGKIVPLEKGTELSGIISSDVKVKARMSNIEKGNYGAVDASGNLKIMDMSYLEEAGSLPMQIKQLALSFNPRNVTLSDCDIRYGKSDFKAKGALDNFIEFAINRDMLRGQINLSSQLIDLNEFASSSEPVENSNAQPAQAMESVIVPANLDITMSATVATLIYDNLEIKSMTGSLIIRDEAVRLSGLNFNVIDGQVSMAGIYKGKAHATPEFEYDLKLNDFDIQKTYKAFETVQKMAPVAERASGSFSASLRVAGQLTPAMDPVMNSLNGNGVLNTKSVVIRNFEPITKLASTLKIDKLAQINTADLNISFKFLNGKVYVEQFPFNMGQYKSIVAGSNGFDQTIDYVMALEIPRSEFGAAANNVLNNLVSEAGKKGIKADIGDMVNVNVLMTGTVLKPEIKTSLKSSAANITDELRSRVTEEFDKKKKELEDQAKAEADKLKREAEDKLRAGEDKAKAEAERLKREAEEKLKAEQEKVKAEAERLKKEAEEKAKKEAQDKLKKLIKP